MQPSLIFCIHLQSRGPTDSQRSKASHAADSFALVCRYDATTLARGLRSPDQDTLPERTRALHRRPQDIRLGMCSLLKNLGLRVAFS